MSSRIIDYSNFWSAPIENAAFKAIFMFAEHPQTENGLYAIFNMD